MFSKICMQHFFTENQCIEWMAWFWLERSLPWKGGVKEGGWGRGGDGGLGGLGTLSPQQILLFVVEWNFQKIPKIYQGFLIKFWIFLKKKLYLEIYFVFMLVFLWIYQSDYSSVAITELQTYIISIQQILI